MDQAVYRGYSAEELALQIDPVRGVPGFDGIQARNNSETLAARKSLACKIDVPYGPDELQKLDIYQPKDKKPGGTTVLFDIHGGGWRGGSKNGRGWPAVAFTQKGLVYVTIDYPLAPRVRIDQIVDSVRQAFAWVHKHIAEYGGDPNRIYVAGHSAGGHLTASLLRDGWHGQYGVPADAIKGAVASSGVFDMEALVHAPRGFNDELKMTVEVARAHSPILHPPKRITPLIVTYGEAETDEFQYQSKAFAKAWTDAGLNCQLIPCPGDHHFSIARTLMEPGTPLNTAVTKMLGI